MRRMISVLVALGVLAPLPAFALREDLHFRITDDLAQRVGFDAATAELIAAGAAAVDKSPATQPLPDVEIRVPVNPLEQVGQTERYEMALVVFHAMGTAYKPDYCNRAAYWLEHHRLAALGSGNPILGGVYLHAVQDRWPHAPFDPGIGLKPGAGHLLASVGGSSPDLFHNQDVPTRRKILRDTVAALSDLHAAWYGSARASIGDAELDWYGETLTHFCGVCDAAAATAGKLEGDAWVDAQWKKRLHKAAPSSRALRDVTIPVLGVKYGGPAGLDVTVDDWKGRPEGKDCSDFRKASLLSSRRSALLGPSAPPQAACRADAALSAKEKDAIWPKVEAVDEALKACQREIGDCDEPPFAVPDRCRGDREGCQPALEAACNQWLHDVAARTGKEPSGNNCAPCAKEWFELLFPAPPSAK